MARDKRTIVITGVAGGWGGRLARRLADEPGLHVIGIDTQPPAKELTKIDFVQADIRNGLLAELFQAEGVDTVCHLAFTSARRPNEQLFDSNVLGTMKLLGACAEAKVRRVVLKSSTEVYGARADNPVFLKEDAPLRAQSRHARTRHLLEIEGFVNNFQRQEPQVGVTLLRFGHVVGPTAESPLMDLLNRHVAVTLLGFDPLLQVIHEVDVVEALAWAVMHDVTGVFNVAADGVLPLARILRLMRIQPVPVVHLLDYYAQRIPVGGRLNPLKDRPLEPDSLRYSLVADLERMRTVMNFTPHFTAESALVDLVQQWRLRPFMSPRVALRQAEDRLRDVIAARRKEEGEMTL